MEGKKEEYEGAIERSQSGDLLNGSRQYREDPQVFKPQRLSHSPIREEPFGLGHIYLLNISKVWS